MLQPTALPPSIWEVSGRAAAEELVGIVTHRMALLEMVWFSFLLCAGAL